MIRNIVTVKQMATAAKNQFGSAAHTTQVCGHGCTEWKLFAGNIEALKIFETFLAEILRPTFYKARAEESRA